MLIVQHLDSKIEKHTKKKTQTNIFLLLFFKASFNIW